MIFTLGLGRSIVIIRIFRFISQNMIIAGEINVNEFKQVSSDLNSDAAGEGVDVALDLGGGLY